MSTIHPEVREYIEANVNLIDRNKWDKFIHNLYYYKTTSLSPDIFFTILCSTLQSAGIDFLNDTLQARQAIMIKALDNAIDDILARNYGKTEDWILPTAIIRTCLKMNLGFSQAEITDMMINVGVHTYELKFDSNVGAFKIEGMK